MSVLQVNGSNVLAFVPLSNWIRIPTYLNGVQVANVEGNYLTTPGGYYSVPNIPEDINSCASDPILGQTVCTANQYSNNVYVIKNTGAGGLPQVTSVVPTAGSGRISFTGGCCTTCGVAMDAKKHKAWIGLSLNGPGGTDNCDTTRTPTGTPGFQVLDLASDVMENPAIPSDAHQISEDWLVDPTSIPPRLLSPSEGKYCNPALASGCHPNYEIGNITYPTGGGPATVQFYENRLDQLSGYPGGDGPDSAAEDCSAEIALASIEFETRTLSTPFIADLTQAIFAGNTWSDPGSQFYPMSGSYLSASSRLAAGPIAIAQGGSHEGVMGQEGSGLSGDPVANTITAFKLNFPYVAGTPFFDWVTCNLGSIPNDSSPFWQGADPHTVTAYQSPNGARHSFAVLANKAPANHLAVVDLDLMLSTTVTRWAQVAYSHVCNVGVPPGSPPGTVGTLPGPGSPTVVVTFPQVR